MIMVFIEAGHVNVEKGVCYNLFLECIKLVRASHKWVYSRAFYENFTYTGQTLNKLVGSSKSSEGIIMREKKTIKRK